MLTTELSQGDQLRTIPGESVAKMKLSLSQLELGFIVSSRHST